MIHVQVWGPSVLFGWKIVSCSQEETVETHYRMNYIMWRSFLAYAPWKGSLTIPVLGVYVSTTKQRIHSFQVHFLISLVQLTQFPQLVHHTWAYTVGILINVLFIQQIYHYRLALLSDHKINMLHRKAVDIVTNRD